jgi:hypothetical protein
MRVVCTKRNLLMGLRSVVKPVEGRVVIMADEKKESSRTKKIRDTKIEDDTFGIKQIIKSGALKASELGDKGGGGGGGMLPDTEKVPGKRPLKMKKGGWSLQLLNGLMVLLKKARRKAGWFNVLNQQHSIF